MKEFKSKFSKLTQILVKMPLFNKFKIVHLINLYQELNSKNCRAAPFICENLGAWWAKATYNVHAESLKQKISIYTYWKLPEAGSSNSYRTPHHKHWSVVWIFERLHDCTTLFFWKKNNFMYKPCFSNLKAGNLRLNPHISKLEAFVLWDARIECQVTFEVLYFHFPEFQSLWKLHLVVSDISYSALSVPFYFCYMFCVNSKMACKRVF